MSHTPTPWVSGGCVVWEKNGDMIADLASPRRPPDETEANTEHIVRCVNEHDQLMEALDWALGWAAKGLEECERAGVDVEPSYKELRAARELLKAGSGAAIHRERAR